MRIFTVTCDGRPAAVVRATDRADAIALTLDLAETRNLLGVAGAPRRFEARQPTEAEMAAWLDRRVEHLILDTPVGLDAAIAA